MTGITSGVSRQSGFTLIEALIAFVILTVGLLGASLFHSQLLRENSNSRSDYVASSIAEAEGEKVRLAVTSTVSSADLAMAIANAVSTSVTDTQLGTVYSVSVGAPSFSPINEGQSGYVELNLTVSWSQDETGGSVSRSETFPQLIAWNLGALANPEEVTLDSGDATYSSDLIKLPTGTLETLTRRLLTEAEILAVVDSDAIASGSKLSVHSYDEDGDGSDDYVVAIKVGDNYVQLARLSELPNELIQISGRIKNDNTKPVADAFGCPAALASLSICSLGDTEDFIDIGATGGGGCLIYDFRNENTETSSKKPENYRAVVGDYLCVVGTGWNGSITPRINGADPEINGEVCSPQSRSYKYVILDPVNVDSFVMAWNEASDLSSASDRASEREAVINSVSVAGQSGLVRFFKEGDPLKSDEGVYWSDYFAHVPAYLTEPTTFRVVDDGGYDVNGMTHQPGDVPYQNFFLFDDNDTCDDYIKNLPSGDELDSQFVSAWLGSVAVDQFLGWNYEPAGYTAATYNQQVTYSGSGNNSVNGGAAILGYTLSRFSVAGTLFLATSNSTASNYIVAGNPEPQISITCDIDLGSPVVSGAYTGYGYSCGVPVGWYGAIIAYPFDSTESTVYEGVTPSDYDLADACGPSYATATRPSFDKIGDSELLQYYFAALGFDLSSALASEAYASAPEKDYTAFNYSVVASEAAYAISSDVEGVDFYFVDDGACVP